METKNLINWCNNDLVPTIVKNGCFDENGDSQTFESCEFESIKNYVNNFSSIPTFAKINFSTPSGSLSRDVIIKFQSANPVIREKMRTEPQYENEVKFFNQVLPLFTEFLKSCGQSPEFIEKVVPKCYFASNGHGVPEKAVIILEDLRISGFRLTDSPTDLDYQHCLLAIERLARLHALSFAMKLRKWQPFEKLKTLFEKVLLSDDPINREQIEDFQAYVCQRGIDYLLKQKDSEVPKEYLEMLREKLKPIFELFKSIHDFTEPLSVLCHGDFNRNNILFRYKNGEVVDAKLIDYQRVLYGPPTLDLGFLIFMNTTLQFREKHLDEMLQYYYSSLVQNVSNITGESYKAINDWIPIQAFREDFERTSLFHYVTVAFFLPYMMMPPDEEFETDMKYKSFKEMGRKYYERGGEEVNQRISEVLLDFYRRKFYLQEIGQYHIRGLKC